MTWPTTPISTEHLDAGTDSPASARADIKSAVDNINAIAGEFGDVDTTGRTTDDVLAWTGSQWAPDTLATVARSGSYDDLTDQPAAYTLPTASTTVLGGVKVDGTTITIADGVISSAGGGSGGGDVAIMTWTALDGDTDTGEPLVVMNEYWDGNNLISLTNPDSFYTSAYRSFRVATTGTYLIESMGFGITGTADVNINLIYGTMSTISGTTASNITIDNTITWGGSARRQWQITGLVVSLSANTDYMFKHNNTTYSSTVYDMPKIKITKLS